MTPKPCDDEIFRNGEHVATVTGMPAEAIEGLVVRLREVTHQRVDWHFVGGRACILALGDARAVADQIEELWSTPRVVVVLGSKFTLPIPDSIERKR